MVLLRNIDLRQKILGIFCHLSVLWTALVRFRCLSDIVLEAVTRFSCSARSSGEPPFSSHSRQKRRLPVFCPAEA